MSLERDTSSATPTTTASTPQPQTAPPSGGGSVRSAVQRAGAFAAQEKVLAPRGGPDAAVQKKASPGAVVQREDKKAADPAPDPAPDPMQEKVDALKALKGATTLGTFASLAEGAAAKGAVTPKSAGQVRTRLTRLDNSKKRAEAVWTPAELATHWTAREAIVLAALPGAIDKNVKTAIDTKSVPAGGIDATNVLWDLNFCSGFKAFAVEDRPPPTDAIKTGKGLARVFKVNDVWGRAIPPAMKQEYATHVGKATPAEAQSVWSAKCIADKKLPELPGADMYTNPVHGFMALGTSAQGVSTKQGAVDAFALTADYATEPAIILCTISGEQVEEQAKAGKSVGKPSIFNHLEFDEFLYAAHDSQFGELAKMDGNTATEEHNGKKEVKVTAFPPSIWKSGKVITD